MMINCKESARRTSELREEQVKGTRKLELWFHLMMCRFCRIYHKQIIILGRIARLVGEASGERANLAAEMSDVKLSEDAKTRIKNNLTAG
jgi:hypothetical protein